MSHPRCELCANNPDDQPHCWLIDSRDEDAGPDLAGMPYAVCRHCSATSEVCDLCDGEGIAYDEDGEEHDFPECLGWGVIPLESRSHSCPQAS